MTKERVFEIMGKHYGNAYYRSAIRLGISEHDLKLTTELLDKINALGYNFSNMHPLMETEDVRFPPLILEYYGKFDALNYQEGTLQLFALNLTANSFRNCCKYISSPMF